MDLRKEEGILAQNLMMLEKKVFKSDMKKVEQKANNRLK
jgi:hypothetical protein